MLPYLLMENIYSFINTNILNIAYHFYLINNFKKFFLEQTLIIATEKSLI